MIAEAIFKITLTIAMAILLFLALLVFQKVWNRIKLRIQKKKNAKLFNNIEEWQANQHGE